MQGGDGAWNGRIEDAMTGPAAITQALAAFVAETRDAAIPSEARRHVANGVTDCAGCIVLGRDEAVTRILLQAIASNGGGDARLLFGRQKASTLDAALVNATSGHAHDYDDTGIGAHPAHPSVVIATALLAAGEAAGASGAQLTTAYVAGYEVWGELARRDPTPHNVAGWHPTAVFGPIAAAAAVANLQRFSARDAAHALGIAASSAGGLIGNFGSMTKPLQVGRAARAGIEAARLAAAGLTAAPDILEKDGGFLASFSPEGGVDRASPVLAGKSWWILSNGPNIKLYPVCYSIHGAIDAMLDLVAARDIRAGDIARVEVEVTPSQAANLYCRMPTDVTGAKFCAGFALAAAAVARRVTMAELTDTFIAAPEVRRLISCVDVATADPKALSTEKRACRLSVSTSRGHTHVVPIDVPRGHFKKPPTRDDLWRKFRDCIGDGLAEAQAEHMFELLQSFEALPDIGALPIVEAARTGATARTY